MESERFTVIFDEDGDPPRNELLDRDTGDVVGMDGGEWEDQTFLRDWAWVPGLLNKLDAVLKASQAELDVTLDELQKARDEIRTLNRRTDKMADSLDDLLETNRQLAATLALRIKGVDAPLEAPAYLCRADRCTNTATHGPPNTEAVACWQHAGDWPEVTPAIRSEYRCNGCAAGCWMCDPIP